MGNYLEAVLKSQSRFGLTGSFKTASEYVVYTIHRGEVYNKGIVFRLIIRCHPSVQLSLHLFEYRAARPSQIVLLVWVVFHIVKAIDRTVFAFGVQ